MNPFETGLAKRTGLALAVLSLSGMALSQVRSAPATYLKLPAPQRIAWPAQPWEGDQQAHTLSVVEINRAGYKYWGWYGLNHGRGMGLARSNDLLHWTKFEGNPLWLNARWPSALKGADPAQPDVLYFAITRDYDSPSSRIVLARSQDGIHLTELKNLVAPVAKQRNQNPNLFRDPATGKFFLTFYRGDDESYFEIVSKSSQTIHELDKASEKVLMRSTETVAAPTLLYVAKRGVDQPGIYYLATEIYPGRYSDTKKGAWQVQVFYSDRADGHFEPVAGNPVQSGERACLFQHSFNGRYYGYQSHLDGATDQWEMEVLVALLPN